MSLTNNHRVSFENCNEIKVLFQRLMWINTWNLLISAVWGHRVTWLESAATLIISCVCATLTWRCFCVSKNTPPRYIQSCWIQWQRECVHVTAPHPLIYPHSLHSAPMWCWRELAAQQRSSWFAAAPLTLNLIQKHEGFCIKPESAQLTCFCSLTTGGCVCPQCSVPQSWTTVFL